MILRLATFAMGTRFEAVLSETGFGGGEDALRAVGEGAIAEIEMWNDRLSLFRTDSTVAHINRAAHAAPVRVDPQTFGLLAAAREVWRASGGAFDITMARPMEAWGFRERGAESGDVAASTPAPADRPWGMDALILDEAARTVAFSRSGMGIDLGAIGKGHALDAAAEVLREGGVHNAILHAGTSSVVALGAPDERPRGWRVALGPPGSGAPVVRLRDGALGVSGQHGRMIEVGGERLGHILDPMTGAPARGALLAAVVCTSATLADAWSTALLVLNRRPAGMPPEMASIVHGDAGWCVDGATAREVVEASGSR